MTRPRPTLAAAVFGLAACGPHPESYYDAREACGLAEGEYHWQEVMWADDDWPSHHPLVPMSEECLVHISSDVGLDWESWVSGPADIVEYIDGLNTDRPHHVAFELYTLLMTDLGTVQDELDRGDTPPALLADLDRYMDRGLLSPGDNLAAGVYLWMTEKFQYTRPNPDLGIGFAYNRADGILWLNYREGEIATLGVIYGYSWLYTLAHEAGHAYSPHDESAERCPQLASDSARQKASCDHDVNGAYGLEGWLAHRSWLAAEDLREAREAAIAAGEPPAPGWWEGSGAGVKGSAQDACYYVDDLSHMGWCHDPEFQEWAQMDFYGKRLY